MGFHYYMYGPGNGWWIGGAILTILFWGAIVLLILAAIRSAKEKVSGASESKMTNITGGMNIPSMF